jgi:flavin-dependent dehydrogenase
MYDVIVAGAGPAGLSAAAELSRKGIKTLLIEKGKIGETDNTWACFADQIKERNLEKAVSTFIDKEIFSAYLVGKSTKHYNMGVFDQKRLLSLLWKRINKKNCKLIENCRFISFDYLQKKEGIIINTTKGKYAAKLLIDAAGYKSPTNLAFGLQKNIFLWQCIAYEIKSFREFNEVLWDFPFHAYKKVNFWIDKISKTRYSIGLMCFTKDVTGWKILRSYLKEYMKIKDIKPKEIIKERKGIIAMNNFEKPYNDNILRVGNAASHASPDAGYGLINAIDDGKLITDTVAEAFRKNDFSKNVLKDYYKRWRSAYALNYHFGKIIERVHYELDDVAFSKILNTFRKDDVWLEKKTKMTLTKGDMIKIILSLLKNKDMLLLIRGLRVQTLFFIIKQLLLVVMN